MDTHFLLRRAVAPRHPLEDDQGEAQSGGEAKNFVGFGWRAHHVEIIPLQLPNNDYRPYPKRFLDSRYDQSTLEVDSYREFDHGHRAGRRTDSAQPDGYGRDLQEDIYRSA